MTIWVGFGGGYKKLKFSYLSLIFLLDPAFMEGKDQPVDFKRVLSHVCVSISEFDGELII